MPQIPISGLATGLDTSALVTQLLTVERRPITLLETRKVKLQTQSTAYQDLNTKLAAFKSAAERLKDPGTFFVRSVTSSADSVATATAAPGVARGTYTVTITSLARGSIAASHDDNTVSALTSTVATGTGVFEFRLGAGGTLVSVAVSGATTLEQLVKDINDKNAGVRASAVNVGTSTDPAWKLTLTSNATGAANNIVIVTDDTTLAVANTQTATDAAFNITGLGGFTRSTNTFSDAIDGVTITLKASSGTTDLTVDYDKSATQARIHTLLESYNTVIKAIDGQSTVKKNIDGTVTSGVFVGDAVARQLRAELKAQMATTLTGTFGSLADIGVTTGTDGTLSLDAGKFQKALTDNGPAVSDLIAGTATRTGVAGLVFQTLETATRTLTGTIALRRDSIATAMRALDAQIQQGLERLATTEARLRARFAALEQAVARIQSTGNSLLAQLNRLEAATTNRR
jgi:flagellar hook-associated protein 2